MFQHLQKSALRAAGARSSLTIGTVIAALAAVCIFSVALVGSELVGTPSARATTPAPRAALAWQLEPRWWPGEVQQARRRAATEPDFTFSKGYAQRVAAREAALAARLATIGPPVGTQFGRSAVVVRKVASVARTERPQDLRLAARSSDMTRERTSEADVRTEALAFGEPQPRPRLFGNLFGGGTLF